MAIRRAAGEVTVLRPDGAPRCYFVTCAPCYVSCRGYAMATKLSVPISEKDIRALKIGDQVLLSGVIFTGRDARIST